MEKMPDDGCVRWQVSPRHEQPEQMLRWRLAAEFREPKLKLGLSESGSWVVIGPSSATEILPSANPVFLFPILKLGRAAALSSLQSQLDQNEIGGDALHKFPIEHLVLAALRSGADHWSAMALEWATEMPATVLLNEALDWLQENGSTQSIRHKARRLHSRTQLG